MLAELSLRAAAFDGLAPASVYLGGGTPSLWDPGDVAEVLSAIRGRFPLPPGAEVTIEANPESCDPGRLAAWRAAGVNRVSVGVQSFDPGVLAKLGRRHSPDDAERAIREAAREIGNVSVDLIYGARRSTPATAAADAARAAGAGAAHVSAYALTLDADVLAEEVPLARMRREGRLSLPSEEETRAQGEAIRAALRRAGLRRYEISNFARPGRESVHNRLYWEGESYLGLGAGAYGCRRGAGGSSSPRTAGSEPDGAGEGSSSPRGAGSDPDCTGEGSSSPRGAGSDPDCTGEGSSSPRTAGSEPDGAGEGSFRYGNVRGVAAYLAAALSGSLPTAEEDAIAPRADRNERLMLALRTRRGAPLGSLSPAQAREAAEAVRRRLAVRRGGRLVLTSRGMDLHSALAERLFE